VVHVAREAQGREVGVGVEVEDAEGGLVEGPDGGPGEAVIPPEEDHPRSLTAEPADLLLQPRRHLRIRGRGGRVEVTGVAEARPGEDGSPLVHVVEPERLSAPEVEPQAQRAGGAADEIGAARRPPGIGGERAPVEPGAEDDEGARGLPVSVPAGGVGEGHGSGAAADRGGAGQVPLDEEQAQRHQLGDGAELALRGAGEGLAEEGRALEAGQEGADSVGEGEEAIDLVPHADGPARHREADHFGVLDEAGGRIEGGHDSDSPGQGASPRRGNGPPRRPSDAGGPGDPVPPGRRVDPSG
jgi:hypothetical protein